MRKPSHFFRTSCFSSVIIFTLILSFAHASTPDHITSEKSIYQTLKQKNSELKNIDIDIIHWPDSLSSKLGRLKKTAFVATHRRSKDSKLPLIISLHGGGGKNWSIEEQLRRSTKVKGLALAEKANRDLILLEPNSFESWDPESLNIALSHFLTLYPQVDTNRIYLIGHSMGGTGTIDWILANPEKFAAASPSGFRIRSEISQLNRIIQLPLWFMAGAEDGPRPGEIQQLVSQLKSLGHKNIGYTAFPGANHPQANAAVFSSTDLVDWLLSHSK